MDIKLDASAFRDALSMLGELSDRGVDIPLDFLQSSDQLIRFDVDTASAGTDEMIVLLKPSDLFLSLLSTSGAGKGKDGVVAQGHGESS